jgi:hypothetical protein
MQIELCRGKTYHDFLTKKIYEAGKTYEVSEEEGRDLLAQHENGMPYFRMVLSDDRAEETTQDAKTGRKTRTTIVRKPATVQPSVDADGEIDTAAGVVV